MQEEKILLEFQRAFQKLNYAQNEMTVGDLEQWSNTWCCKNKIANDLYGCFYILARAYADQELLESFLPLEIKKTRINENR